MTAFRWLVFRALGWAIVFSSACAGLLFMIGWVEWSTRFSGAGTALAIAALEVPERLVQMSPVAIALAGAVLGLGLTRAGEWSALGALGVRLPSRLLPIVAVGLFAGLLGGYASETWVPEAERARQQRVASAQGQPLTEKDALWLRVDDVVFAVRRDEAVYSVRALRWSSDAVENVWEAEGLRWTGGRWLAEVERRQGQPGDAPWISLPPPETLEAFQRVERWAGWRWSQLVEEGSPGARTERGMRVARVLACALAGVVGLTVVLVVGLSTGAVFWAVVPVAGIEGLSLACQSAAAQGVLAPALPGVLRLGLLVGVLAWAVRRLQRPIGYSTLR